MTRIITAHFASLGAAQQAAFTLAQEVPGLRGEVYDAQSDGSVLDAMTLPAEDAAALHAAYLRQGGVVRTRVPEAGIAAATAALRAAGATAIEEQGRTAEGGIAEGGAAAPGDLAGDATEPPPTSGPAADPGRDI
jgi:hypothetical protein